MAAEVSGKQSSLLALLVSFILTLAFCFVVLHRLVFFRHNASAPLIGLLFLLWLCFRIAYPRLADPRKMGIGFIFGLEIFLLFELGMNTYFLRQLDAEAFAASFFLSGGIVLFLDRLRMMFPALKASWPLSIPAFGMAALLFFGSVSSAVLIESTCKGLSAGKCTYSQTLTHSSGQDPSRGPQ